MITAILIGLLVVYSILQGIALVQLMTRVEKLEAAGNQSQVPRVDYQHPWKSNVHDRSDLFDQAEAKKAYETASPVLRAWADRTGNA